MTFNGKKVLAFAEPYRGLKKRTCSLQRVTCAQKLPEVLYQVWSKVTEKM